MLNVYRGGSLHQNLRDVYPGHPELWSPLPRKRVRLTEGSRIGDLMRVGEVSVNSLHRQAIDRLGAGLRVTGRDEYGTVQAIEDPAATFRIGVQWHPEFLIYSRSERRLFEGFVNAVRRFAAARQSS
jgi:putative glutamine amidotransferase